MLFCVIEFYSRKADVDHDFQGRESIPVPPCENGSVNSWRGCPNILYMSVFVVNNFLNSATLRPCCHQGCSKRIIYYPDIRLSDNKLYYPDNYPDTNMALFPVNNFNEGSWKSNKIKFIMGLGGADTVKSRKYNPMVVR